jgi:hypothetical protein
MVMGGVRTLWYEEGLKVRRTTRQPHKIPVSLRGGRSPQEND